MEIAGVYWVSDVGSLGGRVGKRSPPFQRAQEFEDGAVALLSAVIDEHIDRAIVLQDECT